MFAACLLILTAAAGGTLLSFLYDRSAPFAVRIAMGVATGLPLLATVGYVAALAIGLGPASIILAASALAAPFLLLLRREFRSRVNLQLRADPQPDRSRPSHTLIVVAFYCVLAVLMGVVFSHAAYQTPKGIYTGIANNWGDLPMHLQVINSFTLGGNIPPEDPVFAGVRFAYPFMADFLTAMLVRAGADMIAAMWIQNMALALALAGMLHYWTLLLTRSRRAGLIALLLVFASGGLGWVWIFHDLSDSPGGLITLLGSLPHSYTILHNNSILRWGNSLTSLFVPQRSILLGMPLALCILCQWWGVVDEFEAASRSRSFCRMAAAGVMAGLLPLVHTHTFLVVMGMAGCLALIFRRLWREWLLFAGLAILVALPELQWIRGIDAQKLKNFIFWHPGWDHGSYNPVVFWWVNTGLFIPLLLVALLWPSDKDGLPKQVLKFYAPFALCFVVPNFITVAPWAWDNIKVLFWWYTASVPLVAWLLARELRQRSWRRWLAAGAFLSLILAGALDLVRVVSGGETYQEYAPHDLAATEMVLQHTPPHAVVLHAAYTNTPVFLTGRRSLMGHVSWMRSRGVDSSQRLADVRHMLTGAPDAEALLRRYQVDYVLIGPVERSADFGVNMQFWSHYPKVEQVGDYSLYRTSVGAASAAQ